jgi:hypothetical protein
MNCSAPRNVIHQIASIMQLPLNDAELKRAIELSTRLAATLQRATAELAERFSA